MQANNIKWYNTTAGRVGIGLGIAGAVIGVVFIVKHFMEKVGFSLLILVSWGFFLVVGLVIGTIKTYAEMAPVVEERIVRDVNWAMDEAKVKRYRFEVENGTVKLRIRSL